MKFYLSLTDENGQLIDRFRIELPSGDNPADACVSEDSEAIGNLFSNTDLALRLGKAMRQALKNKL